MNKEQFNALEVLEQIQYFNNQLENNNSITSVCKMLGVSRSTIRDRFKKLGYNHSKELNIYVHNRYISDVMQECTGANTKDSKGIEEPYKDITSNDNNGCVTTDIHQENNVSIADVQQDNNVLDIINKSDLEIKDTILNLVNDYDVLKEIIELHRRNTSVVKNQISIDIEESESKLITLRVNSKELQLFNEFCNNNKQYKKIDLISQALKEFRQKYN